MGLTRLPSSAISGGAATTDDISSSFLVGGVSRGEQISKGTTLQQFVEQLLVTVEAAVEVAASASLGGTSAATAEVGTPISGTLTATFSRGEVRGARDGNNAWQTNSSTYKQAGFLVGDVSNNGFVFTLAGSAQAGQNGTTQPNGTVTSTFTLTSGSFGRYGDTAKSYTVAVAHGAGSGSFVNSDGSAFSPTLSGAGTKTSAAVTYTGFRKGYYSKSNTANAFDSLNSSGVRGLSTFANTSNPYKGQTFTISITTGTNSVCIAYPASLGALAQVIDNGSKFPVTQNFTQRTVSVDGATPSQDSTSYYVYTFNAYFSQNVDYIVTI